MALGVEQSACVVQACSPWQVIRRALGIARRRSTRLCQNRQRRPRSHPCALPPGPQQTERSMLRTREYSKFARGSKEMRATVKFCFSHSRLREMSPFLAQISAVSSFKLRGSRQQVASASRPDAQVLIPCFHSISANAPIVHCSCHSSLAVQSDVINQFRKTASV